MISTKWITVTGFSELIANIKDVIYIIADVSGAPIYHQVRTTGWYMTEDRLFWIDNIQF